MILNDPNYLEHIGTKFHSGRYPYGSGKDPYQHAGDFLSRVSKLRKENFTTLDKDGNRITGDTAIAYSMGLSTKDFRTQITIANEERGLMNYYTAKDLRDKGYSNVAIAKKMNLPNESSVRALLDSNRFERMNKSKEFVDFLKERIKENPMIDVGSSAELYLNCSKQKMEQVLYMLQQEGYNVYKGRMEQPTNRGNFTTMKVLCAPGVKNSEIYDWEKVATLADYRLRVGDKGEDFVTKSFQYPASMDSKRLMIRYAEDGGKAQDGLVELRRGVADLDLGDSHYAQVRILVDGKRYIKGMAVYADDLPDGVDVRFNTNKTKDVAMNDVLKKIKDDPDNPFGSLIKEDGGQSYYTDPKTGERKLSLINKRAEEGDWGEWSNSISSQFLSKQTKETIDKQLSLTKADKYAEFEEIMALNNPTLKRKLLEDFADQCDSSAVNLKANGFPRQKYQVIIPEPSIKDNEIYAPNFEDGERVALVRFPHGGTFEIPILKVNNKNTKAQSKVGGSPMDAVVINSKIAEQLSGADFDGDTVMVIPTGKMGVKIKATRPLEGLKNFDPHEEYKERPGMRYMSKENTQKQMGIVSNLVNDMTIKGAPLNEIEKAVKHSMVVIDAEKHKLDYKASEIDNDIAFLKKKWQTHKNPFTGETEKGASTLLTMAKSKQIVDARQGSGIIDPVTGKKTYKIADDLVGIRYKKNSKGERVVDENGNFVKETFMRTQNSTKMAEVDDARKLSSGTLVEEAYADYANTMKSLANQARKSMFENGKYIKLEYDSSAKAIYQNEVNSLEAKLRISKMNQPLERRAIAIATGKINAKKEAYPELKTKAGKKDLKKISQQELVKARELVGAKRIDIKIEPREWEAIQAGAITDTKLTEILRYADQDQVRKYATPRAATTITPAKLSKAKTMRAAGRPMSEIAKAVGFSVSAVQRALKEETKVA